MIIVCSINDLETYRQQLIEQGRQPIIYRTTVGSSRGMSQYTNIACLNPTWDIVMDHRNHVISDEQYLMGYWSQRRGKYVTGYYELLQKQSKACHAFVRGLQADRDYILLCFCSEGKFCHRRIIADKIATYRPELEIVRH